ncbi:MAG: Crp/Fnr family transcriptional regulator [Bacteroidetes bacterium]|nr:MAG: Crp/Fnr family transcriptional regulator [Bacteroidota bacterium]
MYELLIENIRSKVAISEAEEEQLKKYFIPKKYRKRQYLLNGGDICKYFSFVVDGLIRSFTVDDKGHEHVVQFAAEGWWVSDMGSFLEETEAMYHIEAIEDVEVLNLTKPAMEEMLNELPVMERYFRILMQKNIVTLQQRVVADHSLTAEEKYLRLMEIYPKLIHRAPQQQVASYLGITPETLSRIRKQVAEKGD